MTEQESNLLSAVEDACKSNPALVAEVVAATNRGLAATIKDLHHLNADLETLAVLAMARRTKSTDGAILKKLEAVNGRSYVRWDDDIARMRAKERHHD